MALCLYCPEGGSSLNLNNPLPIQPPSKHTAVPVAASQCRKENPSTPTSPATPHPIRVPGLKSDTRENKYSKRTMNRYTQTIMNTSPTKTCCGLSDITKRSGLSNILSISVPWIGFCNKRWKVWNTWGSAIPKLLSSGFSRVQQGSGYGQDISHIQDRLFDHFRCVQCFSKVSLRKKMPISYQFYTYFICYFSPTFLRYLTIIIFLEYFKENFLIFWNKKWIRYSPEC